MKTKSLLLAEREFPVSDDYLDFKSEENLLVQVFTNSLKHDYLETLLKDIQGELPASHIIGCSSDGVIQSGIIFYDGFTLVVITAFKNTTIKVASSGGAGSSRKTGEMLASQLIGSDTKLILSYIDAASLNGEDYLEGMLALNPGLSVTGGLASTKSFTDTFVIAGTQILNSGAVAAVFNSKQLKVSSHQSLGWQALDKTFKVTKGKGCRLEEIDGIPALSLIRKYLGDDIADAMPGLGSAFPFMVVNRGKDIVRGIIGVDGETLILSGNIKRGYTIAISYGNPSSIYLNSHKKVKDLKRSGPGELIFATYCEGRKLFLPDDVVEAELQNLQEVGQVIGCFTLGEFFSSNSPEFLNFSSTFIILSETAVEENIAVKSTKNRIVTDVREQISEGLFNYIEQRTRELDKLAYSEPIAELPNKNRFIWERDKSHTGDSYAAAFIDFQNLQELNDFFGPEYEEIIFREVVRRIRQSSCLKNTLYAYRQDRLAICYKEPGDFYADLKSIAEAISAGLDIADIQLKLRATIGYSALNNRDISSDQLIQEANTASIYSKNLSKSETISSYSDQLNQQLNRRKFLETALVSALEHSEFDVYYQPKVSTFDNKIIGAEALVRWQHKSEGFISPAEFIPISEKIGLIVPISNLVLKKAFEQAKIWTEKFSRDFRIAVNISAIQLETPDFLQNILNLAEDAGLKPENIELELTESVVMEDLESSLVICNEIQNTGINLSLDDFGTGYSSLAYLKKLPFEYLKIDRSFIQNLPDDSDDQSIIRAIMSVAKQLDMKVVAEGVETRQQLNLLKDMQCDEIQGYYFSKPLNASDFDKMLHSAVSESKEMECSL